jgi:hypothetical protein
MQIVEEINSIESYFSGATCLVQLRVSEMLRPKAYTLPHDRLFA